MAIKKTKEEDLVSLNSEFTEFNLQELEQRLETDPLAVGGLLNLTSSHDPSHDPSQSSMVLSDCECHCSAFAHNK